MSLMRLLTAVLKKKMQMLSELRVKIMPQKPILMQKK